MSLRNVKTREGYDYWDKLCAITRHAFLFSSCGKRILATPNMGTWIDEHAASEVVDQAQDEINALRAEVEKLRLQLSACGVAAMANTVNSSEKMRCVNPDFKSGSWQAVCEAVDREMGLRDQRDLLLELLVEARDHVVSSTLLVRGGFIDEIDTAIEACQQGGEE